MFSKRSSKAAQHLGEVAESAARAGGGKREIKDALNKAIRDRGYTHEELGGALTAANDAIAADALASAVKSLDAEITRRRWL